MSDLSQTSTVDNLLYLSSSPRLKGMYGVTVDGPSLCEILGVASLTIVNLQDDLARLRAAIAKHCQEQWASENKRTAYDNELYDALKEGGE